MNSSSINPRRRRRHSHLRYKLSIPADYQQRRSHHDVLAARIDDNAEDGSNDDDQADDDGEGPDTDAETESDGSEVDTSSITTSSEARLGSTEPESIGTDEVNTFPTQTTHYTFHTHLVSHPTISLSSSGEPTPASSDADADTDNSPSHTSHHHGHSALAIALAVAGILCALGLLLYYGRIVYRYRRTPAPDRVSLVADRFQLQREMKEIAGADFFGTPRSFGSFPPLPLPPPAYLHAPSYDEVVADTTVSRPRSWERPGTSPHSERELEPYLREQQPP